MKRVLVLAVPVALVPFVLGACGGDDDDDPTTRSADTLTPDVSTAGDLDPRHLAPGHHRSRTSRCPDISIPDISIPDISIPDLSIPDFSLPDDAEEAARNVLENTGLDDEQIDCLVERLRRSAVTWPTMNEHHGLLEECDIELTDLQPGG